MSDRTYKGVLLPEFVRSMSDEELALARFDGYVPALAGGAAEDLQYPYGVPSVSGTTFTIDFLLENPQRVTRAISRLALQRFYVDKVFSGAGQITGGAVVYEQATQNELYATRDVERVQPGDEFPVVTFGRLQPQTAQVEKFGGKFPVTDEARRRNQQGRIARAIRQLANTIQRKMQQRALSELQAAVTAFSRTATGTSWGDAADTTILNQKATIGPIADLTAVQTGNQVAELGYEYNFAIMNPQEWRNFRLAAGGQVADARALLSDSGINDVWVTNRKAAGTVYWLAQGMVGEIGYEVPLNTEQWRDKDGKQQDWYQSSVLPIMYVTDPYAIIETTGHNA
jgi:hypothetical protein